MNNLLSGVPSTLRIFLRASTSWPTSVSLSSSPLTRSYYRSSSYFRRTPGDARVAMGNQQFAGIFNEKYYDNLEGGILALRRLFRNAVQVYFLPEREQAYGGNGDPVRAHVQPIARVVTSSSPRKMCGSSTIFQTFTPTSRCSLHRMHMVSIRTSSLFSRSC